MMLLKLSGSLVSLASGIVAAAISSADNHADSDALVFRETFADLEAWQDWTFEKIERPSQYATVKVSGMNVLSAKAEQSASGLILGHAFETEAGLSLRWRWRVLHAPDSFRLAIMCDADNTKSRAEAQVEFIEIRRELPARDD